MNKLSVLSPTLEEADLIGRAIAELEETLDLHGRILPKKAHQWDADVLLEVAGQQLRYVCEVKHKIDRRSALLDLKTRGLAKPEGLLVTSYLSHELASACRELGLQFLDTAGNAYLDNGAGLFVYISGRRPHDLSRNTLEQATITPAALRMMFAFLADPSMLNAPYREIAPAVMVSTGAISKVFDTLETRGFIATLPGGKRVIAAPELLLGEWATGYLSRLKPKLKSYRFSGASPAEFSRRWFPENGVSAWGGEPAAAMHTGHLTPGSCTVYIDISEQRVLRELVSDFKLKADPAGPIEVIQAFWNMDRFATSTPTVPLPLIYADLLGTHDARNLTVAKQIAAEIMDDLHR
ncbi:type IV toxin-antitoxin system AbiEi family antitoxin [Massilia sp.]|uniref:type IV toxin-antitoxin system AbiEi family antitoxin n=1 Tax=Massilia sp. TaxID=1882437 RepID=UPI00289D370C|nr:type IV toxin-antitoxin system AbiEi family antitoxin [Massilia sp.]